MKYIKVSKEVFDDDNIIYREFEVYYGFGCYSVICYFTWQGEFPNLNELDKKTIKLENVAKFKVYDDYTPEDAKYYLSKKEYKRRMKNEQRIRGVRRF